MARIGSTDKALLPLENVDVDISTENKSLFWSLLCYSLTSSLCRPTIITASSASFPNCFDFIDFMASDTGFKFYQYDPSFAAAVAFIAFFGIAALWHLWLIIKSRTWSFIPFFIGVVCKLHVDIPIPGLSG